MSPTYSVVLPLEHSLLSSSEDWEEVGTPSPSCSCPSSPITSFSDFGTAGDNDNVSCSGNSDTHAPFLMEMVPKTNEISGGDGMSVVSGMMHDQAFGFGDGNICVSIGTHSFLLHQFKLEEFSSLASLIETTRNRVQGDDTGTGSVLQITLDENPEDFINLLKVLYTSAYYIPSQGYSTAVLRSTLRLATKFQHSCLRTFAIDRLQQQNLTPIERIAISRQSNVPSWVERALDELCAREQPISLEEARILGTETFVRVAARREAYKSKLGEGISAFKDSLYNLQPYTPSLSEGCPESHCANGLALPTLKPPRSSLATLITNAFSTVDSAELSEFDGLKI